MQPALDQLQKWDPENKDAVLSTYYRLSAPEGSPLTKGTILVWPESAFPFTLTQDAGALAAIAELLPPGTALVTGAYREEYPPNGERQVYNTIYAIGDDGTILDAYDKVHLVPFGEYMPAGELLGRFGVRQLTRRARFRPGRSAARSTLPFAPPFLPLICYEIIFSGEVLGEGPRPAFMLNLTNDGWFGRTTGPYQHFHQARVRAVEEGLPLVRAANTGISAIIDPYGRIITVSRARRSDGNRKPPAGVNSTSLLRSVAWRYVPSISSCLPVGCLHKDSLPSVRCMIVLFICSALGARFWADRFAVSHHVPAALG